MNRALRWLLVACLSLLSPLQAAEPMRMIVADSNGQPFAIHDAGGSLIGGIARNLLDAYAAAMGLQAVYRQLPRGRMLEALLEGEAEGACFLNPAWAGEADWLVWSPPLFQSQQVLVAPTRRRALTGAADLQGLRVGTILNYVYPNLDPLFTQGFAQRMDAPSLRANLVKLGQGRIDVLIDVEIAVRHLLHQQGQTASFRIDPLWVAPDDVYCAFSRQFAEHHPGWQAPLQAMIEDGRLASWVAAYTGGAAAAPSSGPAPAGNDDR